MRATRIVCLLTLGLVGAFCSGCSSSTDENSLSETQASAVQSDNQQVKNQHDEADSKQESAMKGENDDQSSNELTLAQALDQVNAGKAVLVDVRSDDEWNASHFAKAKHIPIDKISEDAGAACASLNKDQLVLLHWRSGGRAGRAAKMLKELGYNVQALSTKYETIKEAGFEEAE